MSIGTVVMLIASTMALSWLSRTAIALSAAVCSKPTPPEPFGSHVPAPSKDETAFDIVASWTQRIR
jgi:hypothetical protein